LIEVVSAQVRVAIGGQYLKDPVFDPQNRDIECTAAEVVHRDQALPPFVEPIRDRRGSRFVDDAEHFESGDSRGIARRGALRVVEIRRYGNDGAKCLYIELSPGREKHLSAISQRA